MTIATVTLGAGELKTLKLLWGVQHHQPTRSDLLYGVFDLVHLAMLERDGYITQKVEVDYAGVARTRITVTQSGSSLLAGIYNAGIAALAASGGVIHIDHSGNVSVPSASEQEQAS